MIAQTLYATCQKHAITPLYACESGSRAWGFASSDSDFDVRMIYKHTPDWYMSIYDNKDTLEFITHDLFDVPFDVGGWDIKKALIHIHKSNAVIFEWLYSPIIYHCDDEFIYAIHPVLIEFFNPQAIYHHYQGLAKKINADMDLTKPVHLKKWCYLIRALLASLWLKEYQTMPPVLITKMFHLLDHDEQNELQRTINIKQHQHESHLYQLPKPMIKLTHQLWQHTQHLKFDKKPKGDVELLNHIFQKLAFDK